MTHDFCDTQSSIFNQSCNSNMKEGSERTAYSMLVHTAGRTNDHEKTNKI